MIVVRDPDFTLYNGDALTILRELPDAMVHTACTSPPFYGLRDYGVEGQIGLEETPEQWCNNLVAVFRELRRVLRDDGTLWVECGDSYSSSPPGNVRGVGETSGLHGATTSRRYRETLTAGHATKRDTSRLANVKPKDLIGAPWLLAFALRADGWYLRSCIIWAKPNPMPESVTDRPSSAHSYVFMLSKAARYFWDQEAVREASEMRPQKRFTSRENWNDDGRPAHRRPEGATNPSGRNIRSVWEIPTEPYPEAHFATWPQALCERMIKAGCPEVVCAECGAPYNLEHGSTTTAGMRDVRSVVHGEDATGVRGEVLLEEMRPTLDGQESQDDQGLCDGREGVQVALSTGASDGVEDGVRHGASGCDGRDFGSESGEGRGSPSRERSQGRQPSGEPRRDEEEDPRPSSEAAEEADPVSPLRGMDRSLGPCAECGSTERTSGSVLDCFMGSGTTALVARRLGRKSIGIELNRDYCEMAAKRLSQLSLMGGAAA